MSYTTPHHAHEFMKSAALAIVHQFAMACQRRAAEDKKDLLLRQREINFNARLGAFFGPEASISAQGVSDSDLIVKAPVLEVELKYCRPNPKQTGPVNGWGGVWKDWQWLLQLPAAREKFAKTAWVVFLPSRKLFSFHSCFRVPKKKQAAGAPPRANYAPFVELVAPIPSHPSQLRYTTGPWERDCVLLRHGSVGAPVRIRRQMVGDPDQPIWGLVLSRVARSEAAELGHLDEYAF